MSQSTAAGRRVRPAGGFELFAWFFMRISGLFLVFLAVGHLLIMHVFNNIEDVNYEFVARRWSDPKAGVWWRLWDLALISLAVVHGFNGLRQVLDEHIGKPTTRVLAHTLIWTSAIVLIGLGTYSILMFQADREYLDRFRDANPSRYPSQITNEPASPAPALADASLSREP